MSVSKVSLCLGLFFFSLSTSAEQVVNVHLNDKVPRGQAPSLVVSVHQDLKALILDLRRNDGKKVHQKVVNIPRDSKRTFKIPQKSGRHHYQGNLTVVFRGDDQGSMKLDFYAEVINSLGLNVNREDLDLEKHSLILTAQRPLVKVTYEIISEKGSFLSEWLAKKDASTELPDIFSVLFNSINIMQDQIARSSLRQYPPDVLLAPDLAKVRLLEFDQIDACIQEGERIARVSLPEIQRAIELAS